MPAAPSASHAIVYSKADGTPIQRHIVDCRELVESGEWSWTPPGVPESSGPVEVIDRSLRAEKIREYGQRIATQSVDAGVSMIDGLPLDDPDFDDKLALAKSAEATSKGRVGILRAIEQRVADKLKAATGPVRPS